LKDEQEVILNLNSLLIKMMRLYQQVIDAQSQAILDIIKSRDNHDTMVEIAERDYDFHRSNLMEIERLIQQFKNEHGLDFKDIIH